MNALVSKFPDIESLAERGIVTSYALPDPEGGPVMLLFAPLTPHPAIVPYMVPGVAAVMSQSGNILATFQAGAEKQLEGLNGWKTAPGGTKEALAKLPLMPDNPAMCEAFGYFMAACWKQCWDALQPHLPVYPNGKTWGDDLFNEGQLLFVHRGLHYEARAELAFYEHVTPNLETIFRIAGMDVDYPITFGLHTTVHKLSTLLLGMGHTPYLAEDWETMTTMGIKAPHSLDVIGNAMALTELYWKMVYKSGTGGLISPP